jgi:hypothetical protein
MPDLRLTAAQAARLWSVAREECESILQGLVATGDLQRTADGRYVAPGSLRRTSL